MIQRMESIPIEITARARKHASSARQCIRPFVPVLQRSRRAPTGTAWRGGSGDAYAVTIKTVEYRRAPLHSTDGVVSQITANIGSRGYIEAMPYVTEAELVEIVPELRAMAIVEASAEVRAALNRLADRYAALAATCQKPAQVAMACEFAA